MEVTRLCHSLNSDPMAMKPIMRPSTKNPKRTHTHRGYRSRRGAYLHLFAVSLTLFVGMLAILYDLAQLNYAWRRCQNAADAAALAGGAKIADGAQENSAVSKTLEYLSIWNATASTAEDIHSPPISGKYLGMEGYIEVVAKWNVKMLFFRLLPFGSSEIQVTARAVAGTESFMPGDGVVALNPTARPGLVTSGSSKLRVHGRVVVNSEGGGVDEFGTPVNNGNNGVAISGGSPNSDKGIFAVIVDCVGGVDNPAVFKPLTPDKPSPLHAKMPPEPDPYVSVATPMISNGVDPTFRGSITVTNNGTSGLTQDASGLNRRAVAGEVIAGGLYTATAGDVILHPGIYTGLSINGGRVYFVPGIYVITAQTANQNVIRFNGGTVKADGLMFYNTGKNYNATTGAPDNTDLGIPPPSSPTTSFGRSSFTTSFQTTPIDTSRYNYASLYPGAKAVSSDFNGMMYYQRRHNTQTLQITGNSAQTTLIGTFYGKWMPIQISGQGKYNSQFVVATFAVTGSGNIEVTSGSNTPVASGKAVALVE